MPAKNRLSPFWAFAHDYATCQGKSAFDVDPAELNNVWTLMCPQGQQTYRDAATKYNREYGRQAANQYKRAPVQRHWATQCRLNPSNCRGAVKSLHHPTTTTTTEPVRRRLPPPPAVAPTARRSSATVSAGISEFNYQGHSRGRPVGNPIPAGAESDEDSDVDLWLSDDRLPSPSPRRAVDSYHAETVRCCGDDYTLEEYFDTVAISHPGYDHTGRLPGCAFQQPPPQPGKPARRH